jgi:hypothetical protein
MNDAATPSAALPIAHAALRILVVLNWVSGAAILLLLVAMPTERWILESFRLAPSPDADRLVAGLRGIAVVGLVAIPLHYAILKRLIAIVDSVREGDPFVAANALRLRGIAWALLVLQLLAFAVGAIVRAISTPEHPVNIQAGSWVNGWLAVLLTFLLAGVFAHGTRLRDDLEGTV